MKTAHECRVGGVIMIDGSPWVILKSEFSKSGRNASVCKMKMKNLLNGINTEAVYKADDKFEDVQLERKEVTYSYSAEGNYVFVDEEYNQYELSGEDLGDMERWVEDGMEEICEAVFYEGRVISITPPVSIVRTVAYTEPAARGDTSGKVMKVARLANGTEFSVAAFIETGERVIIDTRTGEYRSRAKD